MFGDVNWKNWRAYIDYDKLIKSTKNKEVEVVNLEQMSPEEVKKHIFGAIKVEDEEEHVQEPLAHYTTKEPAHPVFREEEEHRLDKLRRDIAEEAQIPFSILYGGGGK